MLAIIRVVNPTAARWLVGLASTVGAFAAAAAGWQAFGEVGPAQYAFAGVTALVGGSLAWMQAGRPRKPRSCRTIRCRVNCPAT